jgi:hypothetical protein
MIHKEISHAILIKRCKCMSGWIDGWMDRYDLLLEVMALLSRIIPVSLFFFETWLPLFLSLFFGVMLLWHVIFSLFGATIIWLYFISGMFYERDHQDIEHLLIWNGWMVVITPNVGMQQIDGTCTCLWSRKHKKHLTRVTQFDKTEQNIKQHMCNVFLWNMTYGSGMTLHITGELAFFKFFKNNSRFQASLEQTCTTLFTISELTTI